jgi:hypothetical protein
MLGRFCPNSPAGRIFDKRALLGLATPKFKNTVEKELGDDKMSFRS